MPKKSNQKLKLYYLKKILLEETDEEHGITMPQIIEKLKNYDISAERKSIYRDLEDLYDMGYEVIGEKHGREYRYHIAGREFELAEAKLLADAICASKFVSEQKTTSLIKKIEGLVSKYEAKTLKRQVYLTGRVKTMNESVYYNVDAVHRAIAEEKKIQFLYCSWNVNKKLVPRYDGRLYEISPWALSFNDESYYMIGYDSNREQVRHYRVDKMMNITVTDKPRDGRESIERLQIGEYVTQNFGMCGGKVRNVRIRMPEEMCGIFIDRFGKELVFRPVEDGLTETVVTLAVSENFYGWLFGLGPQITVVGPQSVVDQLGVFARTFAEKYQSHS